MNVLSYISKCSKAEVEEILNFAVVDFLGVKADGVTIVVAENTALLDRLSTQDYDFQALLDKSPLKGTYTLYIRKSAYGNIKAILFHEAVHLAQYERGDLSLDVVSGRTKWKGVEYDVHFPYSQRPWEKEAFDLETKIARVYRRKKRGK